MISIQLKSKQVLLLVLLLLVSGLQGCLPAWSERVGVLPTLPPAPTAMSRTMTQTLEGITVSIFARNADAHRVVLDLTLEGPAQPYVYFLELTWIYEPQMPGMALTAGGEELPFLPEAGGDMI